MTLIEAMKADAEKIAARQYKEFGQKRSFGSAPSVKNNGNREKIEAVIRECGPIRTDEIKEATGVGNACVRFHIRKLVKTGVIEKIRRVDSNGLVGRFAIYAIKEGEA